MLLVRTVIVTLGVQYPTMLFHVRLTHSPENCWARDEQEGRPTTFSNEWRIPRLGRGTNPERVRGAERAHVLLRGRVADLRGLTALLGPPLLEDHEADVVPVTTLSGALDTLEIE